MNTERNSLPHNKGLAALTGFCILLLLLRIYLTSNFTFSFLLWNLFLALIPWRMTRAMDSVGKNIYKIPFALMIILFLPNAPYIVTDLFHLKKELAAPLWLDVMLLCSFSLAGLVYFVRTVSSLLPELEKLVEKAILREALLLIFMFVNGYGIYLGRYLRYNSWDLFIAPAELFQGICSSLTEARLRMDAAGVTLTYGLFLYLLIKQAASYRGQPLQLQADQAEN